MLLIACHVAATSCRPLVSDKLSVSHGNIACEISRATRHFVNHADSGPTSRSNAHRNKSRKYSQHQGNSRWPGGCCENCEHSDALCKATVMSNHRSCTAHTKSSHRSSDAPSSGADQRSCKGALNPATDRNANQRSEPRGKM